MGTLRYPGVPDFVYKDEVMATIQAIIATQQGMGQGFWLERRGMDDGSIVGHDAIWIDPAMHIYIEFDTVEKVFPNQALFDEWKMLLTIHGADRLVISPDEERMRLIKRWLKDGDAGLATPGRDQLH